jgi:sodium transport system permease protein
VSRERSRAFRGFILGGLRQRFRPGTAVLLSSFLFSLYQKNVFQFVPNFVLGAVLALLVFVLGAVLALLVVRSGSVLPALVFHLVYNALLLGPVILPGSFGGLPYVGDGLSALPLLRLLLAAGCTVLAAAVLVAVSVLGRGEPPAAQDGTRKEPP